MDRSNLLGDTVAFVPTTDVTRAVDFYGGVLGLTPVTIDDFAAVFDAGTTRLRITAVPDFSPQPFTVLGWEVSDVAATIRALTQRGVEFVRYEGTEQDELGVWAAPGGALVCWFRDPDGNTLSLTQHP